MNPGRGGGSDQEMVALAEALTAAGDVAGIGIVVVTLSAEGPEFVYASEGAARIVGVAREALLGQSVWSFVAATEREYVEARRRELEQAGLVSSRFDTVLTRPDGSRVPIEVATRRTTYQGRQVAVCYLSDITERQRVVVALQESEARFRTLVENAPDGVAIIIRGRFAYVNAAAVRLLGAEGPAQVVGQSLTSLLEPSDARLAQRRIERLLQTQKRFDEPAEYKSRRADGESIFVEISSIPIHWQGEQAVLGFARDITERKAMQARLLHKDRLAAVGALSAGLAHEINNPLAYLLLNLEFIERELGRMLGPGDQWPALSDRLQDALHGAERVAAIVRDLKTFSRSDDDTRRAVDLAAVVESAIRVAHNTVRHKARLLRRIEPVGAVVGNPQRLEQVVLNLLINAGQALTEGDPARDTVEIRLERSGAQALLSVSDTGPGMTEAERQRIFEPFFTTKAAGGGTGLGLSICRGIVEGVGGSITVVSRPGAGARFEVRLPLAPRPTSDPRPPEALRQRRPGRILVVDDEPALRTSLEALLSEHYEVRSAAGAAEAMQLLAEPEPFDMVLCDVMMPEGSGLELLELVRAQHHELENRFVFMTGGALSESARDFLAKSQIKQLKKPFPIAEVHRLLNDIDED